MDDGQYEEVEAAFEAGRKSGGGAPVRNSFGRGGRAGHLARQHLTNAIRVAAEIMTSDRATDEARTRAADIIIRTAKG